jgi:hypothetical protein
MDLSQLKRAPVEGAPNVEELELPSGERCLSPTKEWVEAISSQPQGKALSAVYMIMGMLGAPSAVILTIAAVKFADANKKIDWENWITNRSNWHEDDKKGAINLLKSIDLRMEEIKAGTMSGKDPLAAMKQILSGESSKVEAPKAKKPEDDWNIN